MAADVLEEALALQRLDAGDDVDRLAAGVQAAERLVDAGVGRAVEVVGLKDLDDVGDRLGREHHGPEDRLLGLQVLRRNAMLGHAPYVISRTRQNPHPSPTSAPLDLRRLRFATHVHIG